MARSRLITPDHAQHLGFPGREGEAHRPAHSHADIDRVLNGLPEPASTVTDGRVPGVPTVGSSLKWAREDHSHGLTRIDRTEIHLTSNQSIPNTAETVVAFNLSNMYNVDLRQGSRIVIQTPGAYDVWFNVQWLSAYPNFDTGGYRSGHIRLNGTTTLIDHHTFFPENYFINPNPTNHGYRVVALNAGDYLETVVLHQHSTNLTESLGIVGGTTYSAHMGVALRTTS